MSIVLQIIGGLVVLAILAIFLGFLWLRWKIRKLARELGTNLEGLGNFSGGPPPRVRLRASSPSHWEAEEVQEEVAELDRFGFDRISSYETPDIPGLIFLPFASRDNRTYAVVYHQAGGIGVWCDIYSRYEDGTALTVTSAPRGGELEHRPGREKAYLPGTPVGKLVEVHQAKISGRPVKPATIEGFANDFEQSYEEEMAWRFSKGYSDDEIRAVATLDGGYSEDIMEQTREMMNTRASEQLTEVLRRKYMVESGLTASEWEDQRDRIVIVHDKQTSEDVLDEVASFLDLGDEPYEVDELVSKPPREFMDWLNESQAPDCKFKKVRTLHEPVEADIWLAPF